MRRRALLRSREDELARQFEMELDNGRLLRVLVKLGFINERPEYNGDRKWRARPPLPAACACALCTRPQLG